MVPAARGPGDLRQQAQQPLRALAILSGLVLLIACGDVAALLTARGHARQSELTTRLALGASRSRLLAQLLTESLLLGAGGAALGLLLARGGVAPILALLGGGQPLHLGVALDANTFLFTAAVTALAVLLFGLAPAWSSTRAPLVPAQRSAMGAPRGRRLGRTLLIGQTALTLVVLVAAGLFAQTLQRLRSEPLGFRAGHLLTFRVAAPAARYPGAATTRLYGRLRRRLSALPGVTGVSYSEVNMINSGSPELGVEVVGPHRAEFETPLWNIVGPGFCRVMGIAIVRGRCISAADGPGAPPAAVVNRAWVKAVLGPHAMAVGREFYQLGKAPFHIVGVMANAKFGAVVNGLQPVGFQAAAQMPPGLGAMTFELRTAGPPLALARAAGRAVRGVDPDLVPLDMRTEKAAIRADLSLYRLFALIAGGFAVLALLLGAIGLEGSMAFWVSQRTNEIGVRMALGAPRAAVARMILGEALALLSAGTLFGLAAAWLAVQELRATVAGAVPASAALLATALIVLECAGLLAAYIPACRAAALDPLTALRRD
ncbi:MAG: FtsX-like permease family protein [Terriglobales bacterium]